MKRWTAAVIGIFLAVWIGLMMPWGHGSQLPRGIGDSDVPDEVTSVFPRPELRGWDTEIDLSFLVVTNKLLFVLALGLVVVVALQWALVLGTNSRLPAVLCVLGAIEAVAWMAMHMLDRGRLGVGGILTAGAFVAGLVAWVQLRPELGRPADLGAPPVDVPPSSI